MRHSLDLNGWVKTTKNEFCGSIQNVIFVVAGNKSHELIGEGKTVLFAFEEAIGFMFSPTVLDKDGVSAACHLATMGTYLRANGQTFMGKLDELYEKYGYHYTKNSYFLCYEPPVVKRIFERIRNFQQTSDSVSISV